MIRLQEEYGVWLQQDEHTKESARKMESQMQGAAEAASFAQQMAGRAPSTAYVCRRSLFGSSLTNAGESL